METRGFAIHGYQQFRLYAKRVKLVTNETEHYDTQFTEIFIEPAQHLKALTLWAFVVIIDNFSFTLTHPIQFPWIP